VKAVDILVKPRAKLNRICIETDERLTVAVTSPPTDGKANAHILKMLAKALDVPKTRVHIVKGAGSRHKAIAVDGFSSADIVARLRERGPNVKE